MAFVPSPDTVQAELVYNFAGQITQNVLHYTPSVSLTDDLMTELADELISVWTTNVAPIVVDTLSLDLVRVTDLSTQFSNGFDITGTLPVSGAMVTSSLQAMPNNCALSITKNTFFRGRSRRGRIYHMGMRSDYAVENVVLASQQTNILAAWTQFINLTTTGAAWEMQVLSRWEDNVQRAQALLTPVEFMSTDGVLDSQRRRLPGRGQ